MADQTELDFQTPQLATKAPVEGKKRFGGFSRAQLIAGFLLIAAIIWGMWVTRALIIPRHEPVATARLSSLVGDYVEAQRFSGSPPDRVRAEMAAFMSSLMKELQRRGEDGQIILVGEAVLTNNVPDITDSLKKAVLAAGVPEPRRLSIDELQRMQAPSAAQVQVPAAGQAQQRTAGQFDRTGTMPPLFGQAPTGPIMPPVHLPARTAGASVSMFGGPDGNGTQ